MNQQEFEFYRPEEETPYTTYSYGDASHEPLKRADDGFSFEEQYGGAFNSSIDRIKLVPRRHHRFEPWIFPVIAIAIVLIGLFSGGRMSPPSPMPHSHSFWQDNWHGDWHRGGPPNFHSMDNDDSR